MAPLVSCVLATSDRHKFFAQGVRQFQSQTFDARKLVVVDDRRKPAAEMVPDDRRVRNIHLPEPRTLSDKLNIGVDAPVGSIIPKLDDDDCYHPEFLSTTVSARQRHDRARFTGGVRLLPGPGRKHRTPDVFPVTAGAPAAPSASTKNCGARSRFGIDRGRSIGGS